LNYGRHLREFSVVKIVKRLKHMKWVIWFFFFQVLYLVWQVINLCSVDNRFFYSNWLGGNWW